MAKKEPSVRDLMKDIWYVKYPSLVGKKVYKAVSLIGDKRKIK